MAIELVTGYQGKDHVTAEQWADFNRGIFGDAAILPIGNKMETAIQTANQISVKDGVAVFDGRQVYIGYGESENIAITSGTQGMLRRDIVVVEYTREEDTGIESVQFKVINGTPAASNAQDPAVQDMDIRTGVFVSQKPFCRVRLNGTAIEGVDSLVQVKEFKDHAFSDPVDTLTGTNPLLSLAAPQGKVLDQKIAAINSALTKVNAVDSKDGSSFNHDFQSIGLNDPDSELSKTAFFLINASEQDQWSHIPTGLITTSVSVGIREVFRYSSTVIMVKVTEIHPKPGTQYYRTYNSGEWNEGGWKVVSPE